MIEIKTQEQFNNINNTINSLPTNGELIRIYTLEDSKEYTLSTPILITRNNVIIEGYGASKPKIKSIITDTGEETGSMIFAKGTIDTRLENITIRNLHLVGNRENKGGCYGIFTKFVGKAFVNTSTSYDSSLVGVDKINLKGITIKDCIVKNNVSTGIYLNTSFNCNVSDNNINNDIENYSYQGINLIGSSCNNIINNKCTDNGYGIYLSSSNNNNIIMGNTCSNDTYGIGITYSNNNIITGNTCNNNSNSGIYLGSSSNNTIIGNICNNNNYGIYLQSSNNNNSITGNTCCNNGIYGIHLYSCSGNTIMGNTVTENKQIGIKTDSNCTNISIYSNIVQNNTVGNYSVSSTGKFEMQYNN